MRPIRRRLKLALATGLVLAAGPVTVAGADVFDGRIAFGSERADPPAGAERSTDIFSMNPDGSDLRRLTPNPELDRQPDWSPSGSDIAYSIRKPGETRNFEVARMTAAGRGHRRLTTSPQNQASSQPSWFPNGRGILFRRSGPGRVASIWRMGLLGESPTLRYQPPHAAVYPTWSPDRSRMLFAAITSPTGDTDRAIFVVRPDGSDLRTLFDVPGSFDSAPAWSPDGRRIAFESAANIGGANPEGDLEIWTMNADGSRLRQLTRNALRDEGPAWSPDGGRLLAYTSGVDDTHGDIQIMTSSGRHLRRLAPYAGLDESPDWQAIPAPTTARRCGDIESRDIRDVRARGRGLRCSGALDVARRWAKAGEPADVHRFSVQVKGFGGTKRVVMRRAEQLLAFMYER